MTLVPRHLSFVRRVPESLGGTTSRKVAIASRNFAFLKQGPKGLRFLLVETTKNGNQQLVDIGHKALAGQHAIIRNQGCWLTCCGWGVAFPLVARSKFFASNKKLSKDFTPPYGVRFHLLGWSSPKPSQTQT